MQRLQEVVDPMASQCLDPQRPLSSRWQHDLDREKLGNLRLQSQTVHASRGDDHAIDLPLAHFAQARVHIAADVLHLQLPVQHEQLRPAAQAARTNTPGTGRRGEPAAVTPHKHVAHIVPGRHSTQVQPRRERRRYVLHTVHGEIDRLTQQRVFNLLYKQPLTPDTRQRVMTVPIPRGANHHDLCRESRVLLPQGLSDPAGLPECHGTAAGA